MSLQQIQELWHGVGEGISIAKELFDIVKGIVEFFKPHCLEVFGSAFKGVLRPSSGV